MAKAFSWGRKQTSPNLSLPVIGGLEWCPDVPAWFPICPPQDPGVGLPDVHIAAEITTSLCDSKPGHSSDHLSLFAGVALAREKKTHHRVLEMIFQKADPNLDGRLERVKQMSLFLSYLLYKQKIIMFLWVFPWTNPKKGLALKK